VTDNIFVFMVIVCGCSYEV